LENVGSIADVDGVDVLFFGPDDMSLQRGLAMDKPRPKGYFDKALKTVADAAEASGKIYGGVFATQQALSTAVEMGYKLIVGTADVVLLANASRETAGLLRACVDNV